MPTYKHYFMQFYLQSLLTTKIKIINHNVSRNVQKFCIIFNLKTTHNRMMIKLITIQI